LEGGTKDEMRMFDALFKVVSTLFGPLTIRISSFVHPSKIFVWEAYNSSVSGPFIPSYCALKWTDIYINGLRGNVKLFRSTINTIESPFDLSHVQSYIFAMNKTTLDFLIECEIFSMTQYAATFEDAIWHREVAMSRKIISNKWNIGSLLPLYKNVDFTFADKRPSEYDTSFVGDIMYPTFRHSLWDEYQLVFIKGNRFGM
jgi:hypothetical protein